MPCQGQTWLSPVNVPRDEDTASTPDHRWNPRAILVPGSVRLAETTTGRFCRHACETLRQVAQASPVGAESKGVRASA